MVKQDEKWVPIKGLEHSEIKAARNGSKDYAEFEGSLASGALWRCAWPRRLPCIVFLQPLLLHIGCASGDAFNEMYCVQASFWCWLWATAGR